MGIAELIVIAIGLSMDAFAVSICKGLSVQKVRLKYVMKAGIWFGGFQALMPLIGYLAGVSFAGLVGTVDHWIAFVLLGLIGANMIKESTQKEEEVCCCQVPDFSFRTMLGLAVATSIDALAVGVSFAFLQVNIWEAILLIGITTFLFSGAGIFIGNFFGSRWKSKAEFAGGFILVAMGLKILLEHTLGA
ncbi:MAG: manganese efflux pump [Bacteroidales bacterium]|nr:manganese efflux pump [Bacteroidales bacterium]